MQSQQRFNRFMNLAIDAQVEASLCGGKDRKQFMRVAQIYCEMAISMPRARREVATPNANGATEGAVASN